MTSAQSILATGFIADAPDQGTVFPSAGGNSADPRVQAVYWRCLTVLYASARITNPDQRLVLFSNVVLPVVDGHDLAKVLARYGVEHRLLPLTTRLARELTPAWGNVLYFFDVLESLADEPTDTRIALIDSDVVVTGPVAPLFGLLDHADYALYAIDTTPDHSVNGLTRRAMGEIVAAIRGAGDGAPVPHYGGEMFATALATWRRDKPMFRALLESAGSGEGPAADVRTEEHIYSIAAAVLQAPVAEAGAFIKRIWTSRHYSSVQPGDEAYPLWHLPSEKRYGFRDLFDDLARRGFPTTMAPAEFRRLAQARCGIPAKSWAKQTRDGWRQLAARLVRP